MTKRAKPRSEATTKRKPKAPGAKGKPRDINNKHLFAFAGTDDDGALIRAEIMFGTTRDARRLAAWLLQAADWSDAQAARRKAKP